ncbi:MAG: VacJ family lipoprotein [Desulfobacteraceae bacterium]|nr:VacJ family lipoprotein [Desulfobacteraceae bacterium]
MKSSKNFIFTFLVVIVCCFSFVAIPSIVISAEDEEFSELMGEYEEKNEETRVADPLYWGNYAVFKFNDKMYTWIVEPAANGYKFVVHERIRNCVGNFFTNLMFPIRFVNNLLQGEIKDAGTEVKIFFINSTVGVLGLAQVAQNDCNLHINDEDFGQTLGKYSIGNGIYIVWPFLGPSTLRDSIGMAGDSLLYPVNYLNSPEAVIGSKVLYSINSTSYRVGDYGNLKKAAIDPYTALKNGYVQQRQEKIKR